MKKLREDFLAGKKPQNCRRCWNEERAGRKSKRMHTLDRLKHVITDTEWTAEAKPLQFLDLKLGNICNLKCRSCNADSSTSWIQDYYKLKDTVKLASGYHWIKSNPDFSFDWVDDESFYNQLTEYAPNLEQIHISGGEPFLVPTHFKLLEKLVTEAVA
jgi:MoaA/NifB/PqqE/SkfB family radical SAM enzyme